MLFNMLSKLVIVFLPRSKHLLISWLQSPSAVILEPPKIKSDTVSTVSPSISLQMDSLPAEPEKSKNTGMGSPFLLQWSFPTHESN